MRRLRLLIAASFCVVLTLAAPPESALGQRLKLPVKTAELEKRARRDSTDASAHYNVALGYWSEERWDDAQRALHESIRLDARLADAHFALALLPFARRRQLWDEIPDGRVPAEWRAALDTASRRYRQAHMIDPLLDLRLLATVVPGRSGLWEDPELADVYKFWVQAFDDFREGKYEPAYFQLERIIEALSVAKRSMKLVPSTIIWYHGVTSAKLGNWTVATDDLRELLRREDKEEKRDRLIYTPLRSNEYRFVLAHMLQRSGQNAEAVALYREALLNDLGLYMAHVQLANLSEQERDMETALAERNRAIAANPDDPTLVFDLGMSLIKAGRLQEAADAMERAIAQNPSDARPYYMAALIHTQLKDTSKARAHLEAFLTRAPSRFERQIADARARLEALK